MVQLLKEFPQAATEKDENACSSFRLHLACYHNQSENVVLQSSKEFPQTATEKDMHGKYPLHFACEYNQSSEMSL
jgi:hypothetical protein